MNANFDPVTLIFIVLAVVIALRLRSVLGRRDEDDSGPMEGYGPRETPPGRHERAEAGGDNVVTLPQTHPHDAQQDETVSADDMDELIEKYVPEGGPVAEGLRAIHQSDNEFNPEVFLSGAKTAYEMIVMAFAEGNRKMLKQLLAKEVYDSFAAAIDEREKKGLIVDSSFIGIDRAKFTHAELRDGRMARVTMKFVSSLITATHNRDGDVIDGDPKKVREVTDIWTFSRDTRSGDPNWQLVATGSSS